MLNCLIRKNKSISREVVIKGFEQYLGRGPESEDVIAAHMTIKSERLLIKVLKSSAEYELRDIDQVPVIDPLSILNSITTKIKNTFIKGKEPNIVYSISENRNRLSQVYYASSNLKIIIFGNCQSLEIVKLMQAMTGGINAVAIETTRTVIDQIKSGEFKIAELVTTSDLIFVQEVGEIINLIEQQFPDDFHKIRRFPCFNFSAYHPDLVYVFSKKTKTFLSGLTGDYQSAIVLASWLDGLSIEQTLSLFRDDVFEALGYYRFWETAEKSMIDAGNRCNLPLHDLFVKWTQQGCWMYSVNHPKKFVLADVARQLLAREHIETILDAEDFVVDGLAKGPVWPVYPEVGQRLGIKGQYRFKSVEGLCPSNQPVLTLALKEFISESYALYGSYEKADLMCERLKSPAFQNISRFLVKNSTSLPSLPLESKEVQQLTVEKKIAPKGGPYVGLPDYQFWRRALEKVAFEEVDPVVKTSFTLKRSDRVATAGSCFAQHISTSLSQHGFNYFVTEHNELITKDEAIRRHYGLFTARYENIYSSKQLVQLFERAYGIFIPVDSYWQRIDGKWVDAFRPQLEPEGFATLEALELSRFEHFKAVREMFEGLDVMVFTLGLTEIWRSKLDGAVYPIAPGVVAGSFDESKYEFINLSVNDIIEDLQLFFKLLQGVNKHAKLILTVSPVPLVATYENRHVLVSTILSKSVLRTAVDQFIKQVSGVDYFPSYEIITGHYNHGKYYEPDLRSVTKAGVQHVMRLFISHYSHQEEGVDLNLMQEIKAVSNIICDEEAIDNG